MKKNELTGWKEVFKFTFVQNFKSKTALITLILMCVGIIIIGPIVSLGAADSAKSVIENLTDTKLSKVYIINNTDYVFSSEKFAEKNSSYSKTEFETYGGTSEDLIKSLDKNPKDEMIAEFSYDEKENKYSIILQKFKDSSINTTDAELFAERIEEAFYHDRASGAGLSDDTIKRIDVNISSEYLSVNDIDGKGNSDEINPFLVTVVMFYSVLFIMMVLLSSQQIAGSLVIEKSSKVIETLMVSVKPLALIVGKISGTLAVLVCNLLAFLVSAVISMILSALMTARKMTETFSDMSEKIADIGNIPGADQAGQIDPGIVISPGRILFGIAAIIVTTILAFLFYAVVAGISGASCSSVEDLQSANSFTVLATLSGIYIAMFAPVVNNAVFTRIAMIYPFSGAAIVPVYYIFGQTGILSVLLVWAELAVLTVLIAKFSAGIYHALIFHKGERLKLKNIIALSGSGKGGVK